MRYLALALLALVACDSRREHGKRELPPGVTVTFNGRDINAKPAGTPRPQSKLAVALDGKTIAMATALAWRVPKSGGVVQLVLSTVPISCDDVTGHMRPYYPDETRFDVGLKDSTLVYATFGNHSEGHPHPIPVTGDGTPGQATTADVDLVLESAGTPTHVLTAKGTIDALGCPAAP